MSVRVFIKPILTKGRYEYGDPVDVTNRCISPLRIKEGVDRNDWEAGVAIIDKCDLTFYNGDGLLSEGGERIDSVFAPAGREGSRVEVHVGNDVRFAGYIFDADSKQDWGEGKLKVTALSPQTILRGRLLDAGLITNRHNPQEAIGRIIQSTEPAANADEGTIAPLSFGMREFPPSVAQSLLFENPEGLVRRSSYDAMTEILSACGCIATVSYSSTGTDGINIHQIGHVRTDITPLVITDPISVKQESGVKRIVNRLTFRVGDAISHISSVLEFGERTRELEYEWLGADRRVDIRDAVLTDNVALPHDLLEINAIIPPDRLPRLALLARMDVSVDETYVSAFKGGALAFGGDLAERRREGLYFSGRIIRYDLDLFTYKAKITLQRRL